jgi:hypothetical protein
MRACSSGALSTGAARTYYRRTTFEQSSLTDRKNVCRFCHGPAFFGARHNGAAIIWFDVAHKQHGGAQMHETTAVVLLVVVLGQIFIFTIAGIAMWLAGEFGQPPRWWRWRKQDTAAQAWEAGDGLLTLHHDLPIAPSHPDDRRQTTEDGKRSGDLPIPTMGSGN